MGVLVTLEIPSLYFTHREETLNRELYNSASNGLLSEVNELLSKGADPNYQPYYGKWTALHSACANNHPEIVRALMQGKADSALKDRIGYTPLHVACMYGYMDCVKEFDSTGLQMQMFTKH